MAKEMVISANPHETRVAVLEDGQLCEVYVEREKEFALVGSIYKGRVTRVLPGMQSSFVDIGLDGDAFLYVSDFLEGIEEYDHIVATVEEKVEKMEEQGGQVFSPAGVAEPAGIHSPQVSSDSAGSAEAPGPKSVAAASTSEPASSAPSYRPRGRDDRGFGHRHGRPGPQGRRCSRNRGHGRELPPSKYASRQPNGAFGEEAAEAFEPVILPGETLAKLKERGPAPSEPSATPSSDSTPATIEKAPAELATKGSDESPRTAPSRGFESHRPNRSEWVTALEPLPGESLAHTSVPPARSLAAPEETPDSAEATPPSAMPPALQEHSRPPLTASMAPAESPSPTELTEEEANALVEQVAEAQLEEEEKEAEEQRQFEGNESAEPLETGFTEEAAEGFAEAEEASEQEIPREETGAAESAEANSRAANEELPAGPEAPAAESESAQARVRGDFRARMQRPMRRGNRRDEARRPFRKHGGHRGQPQRMQSISELLKPGQEIIVQIAKEPLGKKGARITSHIALPGRFLVYMPTLEHSGVSRKIASAEDRARLRHLVTEAKASSGGGFIVRTAAASASADEIRADVEFLTRTWMEIKGRAEQRKAPTLLHRDLNLVERILRDYLGSDYTAIWVDSEEEYAKVLDFVSRFQPQLASRVKLYTKETPVFEEFGIQQEIDKGLRPKVWLKSGGYIVINHTEALVAIDVNTGKFVGRGSTRLEDTIVRTNVEAVKEIVRQIRLRDLGGIIIIDFIDMEERRNREKVMAALDEALKADRAPSKVLRFNEFGLVAITRKRTKQALERTLCQPCPYCTGSGMVKSIPTLCYEIQLEARKMGPEIDAGSITLRVHPEIAKALKTRESALMEELERWTKKSIIIQADPTLHWEQYDIY